MSCSLELLRAYLQQWSHLSNTHELAVNMKEGDELLTAGEMSTSRHQKYQLLYLAYNTNIETSYLCPLP